VRSTPSGFVQTVKPLAPGAGLFARKEWEAEVESIDPNLGALADTPLADLADGKRLRKLVPVVTSEVRRTSWLLNEPDSSLQLDLDQGLIEGGGREQPVSELEIEVRRGDPEAAAQLARTISNSTPLRIGVLSKAERGFALASGAAGKVTKAEPVAVDARMSTAEGFVAIIAACLRHYRLNEPLVVAAKDAAALHQSRVAMRRMRSALTLFKPVLSDTEFPRLREELRWFTNRLGDARNLDVYLDDGANEKDRAEIEAKRDRAYRAVIRSTNSKRLRKLMLDLVLWASLGEWRSGVKSIGALPRYAVKRVDKLWNGIEAAGERLAIMDEDSRHRLRIEVKKMRYALEFFRALFRSEAQDQERFADAIEDLQESLGALNDIVTARRFALHDEADDQRKERRLVKQAERAFSELVEIGPYWQRAAWPLFTSGMKRRPRGVSPAWIEKH
jgi:inorganic triphosphatase YgiF